MSAIWGHISFGCSINEQTGTHMKRPYEEKCKLDRIQECVKPELYMGCGLQYITEESKGEILPIYDEENRYCFTADCLLDNREELLNALEITDSRMPDGTIMYQAFLRWGIQCVSYFRGLFSLGIYDRAKKVLYLAADQVSSRCLYYYMNGKSVTFSTLIEPIRKVHEEIKHNELYLKDFVTAPGLMPNIISDETPYEGICKLNPGTWLEIHEHGVKEHVYWELSRTQCPVKYRTAEEYGIHFRKLYEECVSDALRTDGNVGIALSSGLDSASVGALAAKQLILESKSLYTYTYIPYEKEARATHRNFVQNEEEDVRKIAAMHPNMKVHFLNNHGKNCYDEMDAYVDRMEIPFKAYVNLPSLGEIYEKAAGDGCRVVLTGQMGNGSVSHGYIDDVLYSLYRRKKYVTFLGNLNRYSKHVKESRKAALPGCIRLFDHANKAYAKQEFQYEPDNPFLNSNILRNYPLQNRYEKGGMTCIEKLPMWEVPYRDFLCKKAMYTYMGEYETKLGLASGVILRDPTNDIRMLEFCYHLPYELFAHKGTPRWLIRENLQDILPTEILNDWMRYGVQNSDWSMRILRDLEQIRPKIMQDMNQDMIQAYIDIDKVHTFLGKIGKLPEEEQDMLLAYLLHLCVLSKFIKI